MNEGSPEGKGIFKNPSKQTFLLGLFIGISVITTFAFFFTLAMALDNGSLGGDDAKVADSGNVAGQQDAVVDPAAGVAPTPTPTPVDIEQIVSLDGAHIKGAENATVTMIEYSDFECPYCSKHQETLTQILDEYPNDVRLVYKHFPLSFHANAQKAGEASECAGDQDKFWEMHDLIYAAEALSIDTFKQFAKDLGLDTSKFNTCLDDGTHASTVQSDMVEGQAAGVEGTPATFVNGTLISGAIPYDSFKAVIDAEL